MYEKFKLQMRDFFSRAIFLVESRVIQVQHEFSPFALRPGSVETGQSGTGTPI